MPPKVKESEFGRYVPADDYGFSKYVLSKYIEKADNIYCLRLFGVFGPYEDYEYKFISNSIVKNLLQMPINIVQDVYFDWLYIDDLMFVLRHFLTNDPEERIYNVTSGRTTDLVHIANLINECSDIKSEITIQNEGLNREYSGDNTLLLGEIGNHDFITMNKAIGELIQYYRNNLYKIDRSTIDKDAYISKCIANVKAK